jgi:pimeloyl-ACP methyl ester carboxylesterase
MQTQQAMVRGVPMRWTEAGEGFPVVLVHGIPTSPALWRHVLPQVQGGRLLAFEMVGYGESIPAGWDRDISVARQADYLLGWLDRLGVERAVLVGHDLGGAAAAAGVQGAAGLAAGPLGLPRPPRRVARPRRRKDE